MVDSYAWQDPAGGKSDITTFMPIFYLGELFTSVFGGSSWNGSTFAVPKFNQVSSISISGNNTIGVGGSDSLTVTAMDASGNPVTVDPSKVQWSASGGVISQNGTFAGTAAGTYTVTATYAGQTATATVSVYGTVAGFKISSANGGSLAADKTSTNTVTVTAVDANGNPVGNFNGQYAAVVSDTQNLIAAGNSAGDQPSDVTDNGGTFELSFTNGVATFVVGPTLSQDLSDTITVTGNPTNSAYASLTSASTTVTTVAPGVTSLGLAVASGSPSAISANGQYSTNVTLSAEDAAGNTFSGEPGTYVTLSLTGPGSFAQGVTPVTTESVYVGSTGTLSVPIYSMPGQPGTISISASSTGLTGANLSIPTYINTAAGSISVSSSQATDSNGNTVTLYTVQLLDTNGHPITTSTANDALTISDNSTSSSINGGVTYGTYNSTTGVFNGVGAGPYNTSLTNGTVTFGVETTTVGSGPVTLTINDTTNSFSATSTYSFAAGPAYQLSVSPSSTTAYTVKAGQTVTFSAQLQDSNTNDVAKAGQPVTFGFVNNSPGVTFPTGQSTYTAYTNSNGVASVSFTIPSNAAPGSLEVKANDANLNSTWTDSSNVDVLAATDTQDYATQVQILNSGNATSSVSAVANGTIANTVVAEAQNAVGGTVTPNDEFQITSSNSNVVGVTNEDVASTGGSYTLANDLTVGQAGSAVVTVTDISNPDQPKATFTVNVAAGQAQGPMFEYNGSPIGTNNTVSVAANTPVALQVVNADAAGDPIPVTGSTATVFSLSDGAGIQGDFRATPTGAPESTVSFNPGQSTATVYFVSPVAETLTAGSLVAGYQMSGVVTSNSITQNYAAPVAAVQGTGTAAISGTVTTGGTMTIGVGTDTQSYTYTTSDTPQTIANAIVAAFAGDPTYTVTDGGTPTITFTQKVGTTGSVTPTSTDTGAGLTVADSAGTAGVTGSAAVPQILDLSVTSGATNAGTLTVTVDGTTSVSVPVTAGESAASVATAIYNALAANTTVSGAYTLGNGTAGHVTLTQKTASSTAPTINVVG